MKNQWTDAQKVDLSDYVIENISIENSKKQVSSVHMKIMENLKF